MKRLTYEWPRELSRAIAEYERDGCARLGRILGEDALARLRQSADDLMLGRGPRDSIFYQHDAPTGRYADLESGRGFVGPSLAYRKLEKLERDPAFLEHVTNPLFEAIATRVLGPEVTLYRAVLFNKAPKTGSEIPFHQDGGSFWGLDRPPRLQIWTALDDIGQEQGCLEFVPGSHRAGLATPLGGVIPDHVVDARRPLELVSVPVRAGEALLIHNDVWHRSGRNVSGDRRRAVTVCYLEAATRCLRRKRAPREFLRVFPRNENTSPEGGVRL